MKSAGRILWIKKKIKDITDKTNWKALNFAVYFELVISYFLPYVIVDEYKYQVGFPIPFLTIYNKPIIHANPYLSMQLNHYSLAVDLLLIYFLVGLTLKLYKKFKLDKRIVK